MLFFSKREEWANKDTHFHLALVRRWSHLPSCADGQKPRKLRKKGTGIKGLAVYYRGITGMVALKMSLVGRIGFP